MKFTTYLFALLTSASAFAGSLNCPGVGHFVMDGDKLMITWDKAIVGDANPNDLASIRSAVGVVSAWGADRMGIDLVFTSGIENEYTRLDYTLPNRQAASVRCTEM